MLVSSDVLDRDGCVRAKQPHGEPRYLHRRQGDSQLVHTGNEAARQDRNHVTGTQDVWQDQKALDRQCDVLCQLLLAHRR